ncbi:acyltransferase [Acidipila sp. EB88]|uniref:acyltransferase family protein n=1 Tax=Acidipila sp. EB88 TaxID=2305226 RepID=UPI000F5DB8B7|nr:acyltransferase [Acidipila sp. EB88]RRA49781.1 acyltransferase [Acidipila sp. EB88]
MSAGPALHFPENKSIPKYGSTSGPAASRFYRPELDVLRFCAFVAVFLDHGTQIDLKHGHLQNHPALAQAIVFIHLIGSFGLSLFFLLSAFLITTLLVIEQDRSGHIDLRKFYVRRALRIWPLYFCYVTASFVLGQFWSPAHISTPAFISFFLLSTNWYVMSAGMMSKIVAFLWSISIEEQFYLFWPAVVGRLSRTHLRNICIAIPVISMSLLGIFATRGASYLQLWADSGIQMMFFAAGGLLALQLGRKKQDTSALKSLGGIVCGLSIWVGADLLIGMPTGDYPASAWRITAAYFFILLGSAALLWAFLRLPKICIRPSFVYLGRISYGLYVFHGFAVLLGAHVLGPVLHLRSWPLISLLITIGLAALSYEFLEKPFLKLKHRFEIVHSRVA